MSYDVSFKRLIYQLMENRDSNLSCSIYTCMTQQRGHFPDRVSAASSDLWKKKKETLTLVSNRLFPPKWFQHWFRARAKFRASSSLFDIQQKIYQVGSKKTGAPLALKLCWTTTNSWLHQIHWQIFETAYYWYVPVCQNRTCSMKTILQRAKNISNVCYI